MPGIIIAHQFAVEWSEEEKMGTRQAVPNLRLFFAVLCCMYSGNLENH